MARSGAAGCAQPACVCATRPQRASAIAAAACARDPAFLSVTLPLSEIQPVPAPTAHSPAASQAGTHRAPKAGALLLLCTGFALCTWYSLRHGALSPAAGTDAAPAPLGTPALLIALLPPLACWVLAAWCTRARWPVAIASVLVLAAVLHERHNPLAYLRALWLLDHVSANLAFAALFGRSLRAHRKPLISRFAEHLHGTLSPLQAAYTRAVTLGWTIAFVSVAAASLVVFYLWPFGRWSEFAWFCALPLTLFLFLMEFLCRCLVLPKDQRSGLIETVRVVSRHGIRPGAPSRSR